MKHTTKNLAYLDHNVIDRIDTVLSDSLLSFLKKKVLNPVFSTASLGEIERSGRPDRVEACISSLIGIGAKAILEHDSKIQIVKLNKEQLYDLMSNKNKLIVDIVRIMNDNQFSILSATSRSDLENSLSEINCLIGKIIERHKETIDPKFLHDLQQQLQYNKNILDDYLPDQFNYIIDLRERLGTNPRVINNLTHEVLWETIKEVAQANKESFPSNTFRGNLRERIYFGLMVLNNLGYWSDSFDSREKQLAFNYDCQHGIYGTLCKAIISHDKRFLKRLRAVYYYWGIECKAVLVKDGMILEKDY